MTGGATFQMKRSVESGIKNSKDRKDSFGKSNENQQKKNW